MQILNIAGYKFIALPDIVSLRHQLKTCCETLALKGTILLSQEGININMSGTVDNIKGFKDYLGKLPAFQDMTFRESYSDNQPFRRLKIKLKNEIITMRQPDIQPEQTRAPAILPTTLKQWLDEKRDLILLDTRNEYEIEFGTFTGATNLHINHFCEFPAASQRLERDKPIVMFCTGGIRCEKAALQLIKEGYHDVYQLDGGILNYFVQVGGEHYQGTCYVFDERMTVTPS